MTRNGRGDFCLLVVILESPITFILPRYQFKVEVEVREENGEDKMKNERL